MSAEVKLKPGCTTPAFRERTFTFYLVYGSAAFGSGYAATMLLALALFSHTREPHPMAWPVLGPVMVVVTMTTWFRLVFGYPFGLRLPERRHTDLDEPWSKESLRVLDQVYALLNGRWNGVGQGRVRAKKARFLLQRHRPTESEFLMSHFASLEATCRLFGHLPN